MSHDDLTEHVARDASLRPYYLEGFGDHIARLLGNIDRNPYRDTYGCLDRQFWHYRTAAFPSGMYQEGVLPLALAYACRLPGNRWIGEPRLHELAVAGIRFAARSSHADGSCDDYYPYERALGAAVFSLVAAARAYQLLRLADDEIAAWLCRRARWIADHDESGRLANHHAAAALGLLLVSEISGDRVFRQAAEARLDQLLAWQDDEGWFDEYGGADPGYQTVTIDYLAQYSRRTGERRLDAPLAKAVDFARLFLHADDSYGGAYGSRGTCHFYPHGFELLAARSAAAAELADGFLRSVRHGSAARFADDRLFSHRLASRIEAYCHWSATRPASTATPNSFVYLPNAEMLICRGGDASTVVSAARGGAFAYAEAGKPPYSDAGLIVETQSGTIATSQWHGREQDVCFSVSDAAIRGRSAVLRIARALVAARFETATPLKQALLHLGMISLGRWCRTAVRRLLQRRVITGRRALPIRLVREFRLGGLEGDALELTVVDTISLTDPSVRVRRMAYGPDYQATYVAATGVYQQSALQSWTDLGQFVDELNRSRSVTVERVIAGQPLARIARVQAAGESRRPGEKEE